MKKVVLLSSVLAAGLMAAPAYAQTGDASQVNAPSNADKSSQKKLIEQEIAKQTAALNKFDEKYPLYANTEAGKKAKQDIYNLINTKHAKPAPWMIGDCPYNYTPVSLQSAYEHVDHIGDWGLLTNPDWNRFKKEYEAIVNKFDAAYESAAKAEQKIKDGNATEANREALLGALEIQHIELPSTDGIEPASTKSELDKLRNAAEEAYTNTKKDIEKATVIDDAKYKELEAEIQDYKNKVDKFLEEYAKATSNKALYDELISDIQTEDWKTLHEVQDKVKELPQGIVDQIDPADWEKAYQGQIEALQNAVEDAYKKGESAKDYQKNHDKINEIRDALKNLLKQIDDLVKANDDKYKEQKDLFDKLTVPTDLVDHSCGSTEADKDVRDKAQAAKDAYTKAQTEIEKSHNNGTSVKDETANKALLDAYNTARTDYENAWKKAEANNQRYQNDLNAVKGEFALPTGPKTWEVNPTDKDKNPDQEWSDAAKAAVEGAYTAMEKAYNDYLDAAKYDWDKEVTDAAHAANTLAKLADYKNKLKTYNSELDKAQKNDEQYAKDFDAFMKETQPQYLAGWWHVNPTDKDVDDAEWSDEATKQIEASSTKLKASWNAYNTAIRTAFEAEQSVAKASANAALLATYHADVEAHKALEKLAKANDAQYVEDVNALVALRKAANLTPKDWKVTTDEDGKPLNPAEVGDYSDEANKVVTSAYNAAVSAYDAYNDAIHYSFEHMTSVADADANAALLETYKTKLAEYDQALKDAKANDDAFKAGVAEAADFKKNVLDVAKAKYVADPWADWSKEFKEIEDALKKYNTDLEQAWEDMKAVEFNAPEVLAPIKTALKELIKKIEENHGDYNHAKDYSNDLNHLLETIEQTLEADIVKRADHTELPAKNLFLNDEVYNDLNKYFEDTYPAYDIDALKVEHDLSKVIGNLTAKIRQDFLDHKAHETLEENMKAADAIKKCLEDLQAKAEELIAANLAAHDQQIADLGDKLTKDEWHKTYAALADELNSDAAVADMDAKLTAAETAWETAKAEIEKHYNDGDANHDDVKAAIALLDKAYEDAVKAYETAVENAQKNQAAYETLMGNIDALETELQKVYDRFVDTESAGALANHDVEKKKVQDAIDAVVKEIVEAWNHYNPKRADELQTALQKKIDDIYTNELKHFNEWTDAEIFNQEAYVELTANKKAVQDDLNGLVAVQPATASIGANAEMNAAKNAAQAALNAIDILTPYNQNPLHGPAIDAAKKKALQDAIDAAQVLVNKYFDLCAKAQKNEEVYQAKLKEYKAAWDQAAQDAADNAAGKFCFKSEKGYDPAEESATAHANIETAAAEQAAALTASKKELEDQYNYVPATSSLVKNVGEAVGTRKSVWVEDVTAAEYENLVKENGEFKAEVEKAQANIDAYEEKYDRIQNELQKPLTALVNYYKSDSWTNWDAEKQQLQDAIDDLIKDLKAAYQAETAVAFDVENPIKFIAYATDMLEKYINANMDAYNVIKSSYDEAEDMIREIKKFYDMAQPGVQDDLRAELGLAETFRTDYINEITDGIANAQQHCKDHLYVKDEAGHLTETSDKYTEDKTYLDDLGAADALKDAHYAVDGKAGLAEILQTLMKYIDANDAAYAEQTNDLKDSFEASEPLEVYVTESTTAKQDLIDKEAAVHTAYNTAHDAIEKSYNDGTSVKDDAANKALVDAYDAAVAAYQQAVLDAKHNDTVKSELDGVIAGHKSYYDQVVASDAKLAAGELYGSTTAQADVADKRDKAAQAKADAEKALADAYNDEELIVLGEKEVVKSDREALVEKALADYEKAVEAYEEALRKANLNDAKNDELNKKLDAAKDEYVRVAGLDVTPTASTEGKRIVADAMGELNTALTIAANALANNYDDELLINEDVVKTVEGLIADVNAKAKAYEAAVKQANDNEAANVVVSGAIADATAAADALEAFINTADWEIIKKHYSELLDEVDGYRDQIQDITDRLFEAYDKKADAQGIKDQLLSELKDLLATLKQDLADAKFYNEHLGDVDLNGKRDYEDYAQLIELVLDKAEASSHMQADMNINDEVDGGDVVILNNWLTYGKTYKPDALEEYERPLKAQATAFEADMDLEANGKVVALNINNNRGFAVLQFDLFLSDGVTLANLGLTERAGAHMIKSRKQADGSYRVLVMNNGATTNMEGNNGAVLNLTFAGEGEIEVSHVLVADVNGNTYGLGAAAALVGSTTGIDEVATSVDAEFYGVNGIRNTKAQQGVNIIRNTDGSVKKVIKK